MWLQDGASSQHIMCLCCVMGFQGRRQKSLFGLAKRGFDGARRATRDPLPCLNHTGGRWQSLAAGDTLKSREMEKEKNNPQYLALALNSPFTIHCTMLP